MRCARASITRIRRFCVGTNPLHHSCAGLAPAFRGDGGGGGGGRRINPSRGPFTYGYGQRCYFSFWSPKSPTKEPDTEIKAEFLPDSTANGNAVDNFAVDSTRTVAPPSTSLLHDSPTAEVVASQQQQQDITAPGHDVAGQVFSPDVMQSVTHIGDLKALGLAQATPPGFLQQVMEYLHVSFGMPWWATILASTVTLRLALFPLALQMQRTAAKFREIQPEMEIIQNKMREAMSAGNKVEMKKAVEEHALLHKTHGVGPFSMIKMAIVQAPIFISFFLALRGMAELPVPGFNVGGLAWFSDLSVKDPFYILPALSISTILLTLKFDAGVAMSEKQQKAMSQMRKLFGLLLIPMGIGISQFPAALSFYWTCSNLISIIQATSLRNPAFRRLFKLPPVQAVGGVQKKDAAIKDQILPETRTTHRLSQSETKQV